MWTKEIQRRIIMGKSAMSKSERILINKNVTKKNKIKIVETLVFPIVTYGSESWTMRKKDKKKTWCFWTMGMAETSKSVGDRKENNEILQN